MQKSLIKSYVHNLSLHELGVSEAYASTDGGFEYYKLLQENIFLNNVIEQQNRSIKILNKQVDTHNKTGLALRLAELSNSIWRIILNINSAAIERSIENDDQWRLENQLKIFIQKLCITSDIVHNAYNGRIFIDVTSAMQAHFPSGISRVVTELSRQLLAKNVFFIFINERGVFASNSINQNEHVYMVDFKEDDILLMMDAGWDNRHNLISAMENNKRCGGINISIVYDLIPINYPEFCGSLSSAKFKLWLDQCVAKSDHVVCISQSVAIDIEKYFTKYNPEVVSSIVVDYFHLGSEFIVQSDDNISANIRDIIKSDTIRLLSVGTVEPKKGYLIALEAMELVWMTGANITYIIAGRYGWDQQKLREKIYAHPEYGKKLIWLENVTDADLSMLYSNSRFLIYPSITEGFGLPLIEGAQHGLPAIASDIEVFREIAGESVTYFNVADPKCLADKILRSLSERQMPPLIKYLTWQESKTMLWQRIIKFIESTN